MDQLHYPHSINVAGFWNDQRSYFPLAKFRLTWRPVK